MKWETYKASATLNDLNVTFDLDQGVTIEIPKVPGLNAALRLEYPEMDQKMAEQVCYATAQWIATLNDKLK